MWSLLAIVLGALGLLYAWWPLRRGADAPPLPDEGMAVGDPAIADEAFEIARRWSLAAGEIGTVAARALGTVGTEEVGTAAASEVRPVGAGDNLSHPGDPPDRTDGRSADRAVADGEDEEGS